jgi:AraC-like DNA-binding protein
MSSWQGSHYPAVAKDDLVRELYLTSLGRIAYPSGAVYPTSGHPAEFQFSWEKGRIMGDFTLLWIEEGHGDAESIALGRVSILPGTVLLLPPGEWHRYRPTPKSGWVERWICANGTFLHRLKLNGVFPSTSELRSVGHLQLLNEAFDQLQQQADRNCLWVSALTLSVIALALGEIEPVANEVLGNNGSGDSAVDAAIFYIWNNCHRPLNVDSIAISRRMLERRFAHVWLRSVAQELTLARVQRGRDLLSENSLTVKEAGYAAGFGGAKRFISAHQRLLGTTPGVARHQGNSSSVVSSKFVT